MINRIYLHIVFLTVFPVFISAQEVVTGLQTNPAILNKSVKHSQSKGINAEPLELPFFDDFSENTNVPSTERWSDNFVFINNTYSDTQITTGVATFDAIDNSGRLYETLTSEVSEADNLTSQPINLNYTSSDDIWLSFFYEPGGLADSPEIKDSLTLQFFAPEEDQWYSIWKADDVTAKGFKPVIININQPRYLKNGFRFRFKNYASLSPDPDNPSMKSNCDQWNIDYIVLDKNRNVADTSLNDVAFRTSLRSILKTHEAMPWKQFKQVYLQEMGSAIPIHYRNNDAIVRNVTRNFSIQDVYAKTLSHSFSAGATNIEPFTNIDYNANLIYTFNNSLADSALFRITCYLITDDFDPKQNDTIKYDQVFTNYFAFDDGSSEGGYGINGLGSRNAMVAYRFKSYMQDTIRAIRICFNDSYLNSNLRAFDLMIWDDENDMPGNLLYSVNDLTVEQGTGVNGFYTYVLPDGVMVDDVFYIGWKQRSETYLNAGFDVNTPNKGRQFFWLNGYWNQSEKQGSIMIRPVVGKALTTTSVDDTYVNIKSSLKLYPNPAAGLINLVSDELSGSAAAFVSIIDFQGRLLMKVPYSEQIDISTLKTGIYTVIPTINGRPVGHLRLVKTR